MAKNMNKVMLSGNITRDANITGEGNKKTAWFNLANNRGKNNQTGEDYVLFIDCCLRGEKRVDGLAKYLVKGVGFKWLEGHLETWNKKNQDGTYTRGYVVVVDDFEFVPKRGGTTATETAAPAPAAPAPTAQTVQQKEQEVAFDLTIDSDDLPF